MEQSLSTLKPINSENFNLTMVGKQRLVKLKAKKGPSVVVMNKEEYIRGACRQLSETNFTIETLSPAN